MASGNSRGCPLSYFASTLLLEGYEHRDKFAAPGNLERSLSSSLLASEMEGVLQLLRPLISKELANTSWLCQMSCCVLLVTALKLRSPLLILSREALHSNCNWQKSLMVLRSPYADDSVDARRTEEVKGGTTLCAFESQRHPELAAAFKKTSPHSCFFVMASLGQYKITDFSWVTPKFLSLSAKEAVCFSLCPSE